MPTEKIDNILIALAFSGVAITIAVVFLFSVFVRRKNKLIREQLEEQLAYQKKMHAVELKALRGQMNPHFVHNSLNAIQYYIQRNEVEISENYLVKFSKLIRLFFEYSRRQKVTIAEEIELLTNYLDIEKLRFEEKLNFRIISDPEIEEDEQVIPSMILQPLVENSVNHGLFHKKENGTVTVHFKHVNEMKFQCIIEDDGIGINKSKAIYNKSSKNYQSHSSEVLQERLELLKASNDWDIEYKIIDLSETASGNQSGTRVILTFNQIEHS